MVVFLLVIDVVNFASLWVLYRERKHDTTTSYKARFGLHWQPFSFSRLSGNIFPVISKFIYSLKCFYRLSRTSIALSLTRVFPAFNIARRSAFVLAVICVLSYLCCVFILTFECPSVDAPWYETVASHCHKTGTAFLVRDVGSACEFFFLVHINLCIDDCRLSVDLSVDSIFIIFPIITLWRVKLPRNLRRIIISAFSGSALTLITGIMFCILGYNTKVESRLCHPNNSTPS